MKTLRAHGFNQRPRFEQVVGLERNEPLPLDQPDRKATSFVTSHFYLDDFVQSSEDPNPWPLQHTPCIPEDGFRTPAEATDEDVRLARRYQGYGGTRFVEDDLAGDPEAGALASNGQGPPSITDRLHSTADGAQAAADLIGAGAAWILEPASLSQKVTNAPMSFVKARATVTLCSATPFGTLDCCVCTVGWLNTRDLPERSTRLKDSTSAESRTTWEARTRTFWISNSAWPPPGARRRSRTTAQSWRPQTQFLSPGSAAAAASSRSAGCPPWWGAAARPRSRLGAPRGRCAGRSLRRNPPWPSCGCTLCPSAGHARPRCGRSS